MSEARWQRWARRSITFPGYVAALLIVAALLPIWLPLTTLADLVFRTSLHRAGLFACAYLSIELYGLARALAMLPPSRGDAAAESAFLARNFKLQCQFASALLAAAVRLFKLRLRVEGTEALTPGPVLLMVRHVSVADTVLAGALVSGPTGLRLRYVLKRELLWDPCLDIVGHRLPNCFVTRGGADPHGEADRVAALGYDLGPDDGVAIFPEGTRFSHPRLLRAKQRLKDAELSDAARAHAAALRHVLPPRLLGPLRLLDAAPDADVVVCTHTGFEGITTLRDLWDGTLTGRTVQVAFRRIPRHAIPAGDAVRTDWLLATWSDVDAWVESHAAHA